MKIKKLSKCLIILLFPILLCGCFNYQDINKVTFATSIIFDTDDFGNVIVYLDCVKPYRSTNESSDKGRRIIYKGIGKTALEALKDVNLASSYELNYSQNRAYIFTEKAAREGIDKYLDLLNNNQQFQVKPDLFVYFGNVDDLLEVTSADEEYLGLYLEELVHKNSRNPRAMRANINEYFSERLIGNNTDVIGVIKIREDALDKKIEIDGGAVLKDNVLIERIEAKDAMSFNLLMDNVKGGSLELPNPQSDGDYISLEILDCKTLSSIKKDGDRLKLIKNMEIKVSLAEAQGLLAINNDLLKYIEVNKETQLENYLVNIFDKYKCKDLDIFNIERLVEINYPNEKIEDPISITDLEVNIKLIIDGTGITRESL